MRGYLPIEELCGKAEIEGVKVGESGSLIIYARNLENRERVVTGIYVTDFEGRVLLFEKGIFKLKPKEARKIVL